MCVSYAIIFAHRFLCVFMQIDDDVFRPVFFCTLPGLGVLISDVVLLIGDRIVAMGLYHDS